MKIAAPPSPVPAVSPWQERFGKDAEGHAENFGDLLAAMLSSRVNEQERTAEPVPRIGSGGKAFEDARLLVETALDFHGIGAGPAAAYRAHDILHAEHPAPAVNAGGSVPPSPRPTLSEHLEHWLVRLAPASLRAVPIASLPVPPAVTRPLVASGDASIARPAPVSTAAGPIRHASVERALRADPPRAPASHRTTRSVSPFGAHLLAFEGGLRLLLRLPRLAEGERAELEARVARLFETFGHRKHDIVIQEIAKGEG